MIVFRRRLLFWLFKAYIKKSGKTLVLSFILGFLVFVILIFAGKNISRIFPSSERQIIGMVGSYTVDSLPKSIVDTLSSGLTFVNANGEIKPALSDSWTIDNLGKTYTFYLKKNLFFADGTPVTSSQIAYDFSDVKVTRPDALTIKFDLKDAYSPFLVTVSQPVFKKGFVGTNNAKIRSIDLNGSFVRMMTVNTLNASKKVTEYKFYPSEEALKVAFAMGEVNQATGLKSDSFKNSTFSKFSNVKANRHIDYSLLVSIFYNTEDPLLSDKKLRTALSYALPDTFPQGQRTTFPLPPQSLYFNHDITSRQRDTQHSKLLLDSINQTASDSAKQTITIQTLDKYEDVAKTVSSAWNKVGVKTKIETVDRIPSHFQVYIGDFSVPKDPDQYTLWHSGQVNNITRFKNLRIDKLLEDGRKVSAIEERKKIYADFQKYLLDESPATFLYFPYSYTLVRS